MSTQEAEKQFSVVNTHVTDVNGSPLHYSFTTGLDGFGLKEMCVYGVNPGVAVPTINKLVRAYREGKIATDRKYPDIIKDLDVVLKDVSATDSIKRFGPSNKNPVIARDMVQIVWPDANNIFPWEPGFDESQRHLQYALYR